MQDRIVDTALAVYIILAILFYATYVWYTDDN